MIIETIISLEIDPVLFNAIQEAIKLSLGNKAFLTYFFINPRRKVWVTEASQGLYYIQQINNYNPEGDQECHSAMALEG